MKYFRDPYSVAVVIPCYKVKQNILEVLRKIPDLVEKIYVIDDACPENTYKFIEDNYFDERIKIIRIRKNRGVGGAVKVGYRKAISDGFKIIVKIDGDGQMDPNLIEELIEPIKNGSSDYVKGNRFYNLDDLKGMPSNRIFGNAVLSFLTKISSGYWDIFDPTNGFTAIHSDVCKKIKLSKVSNRFFFESDMLFRLNICRAVVSDYPMKAVYKNEKSNLEISKVIFEFLYKHAKNCLKRIFYNYYLRDLTIASFVLPAGLIMTIIGFLFGAYKWYLSLITGDFASSGTVMISALLLILGINFILNFIAYDIENVPKKVIHSR